MKINSYTHHFIQSTIDEGIAKWELPRKWDVDAYGPSEWCKLQMLVSLRVFRTEGQR